MAIDALKRRFFREFNDISSNYQNIPNKEKLKHTCSRLNNEQRYVIKRTMNMYYEHTVKKLNMGNEFDRNSQLNDLSQTTKHSMIYYNWLNAR
jgi:inorganic pyrophosphatase